ncbi:MAG: hypothetical protein JWM11_7624 [Planctomycetaceae bacterium]|nr:hypothetical protein [Planctomycetaceae bacterium]
MRRLIAGISIEKDSFVAANSIIPGFGIMAELARQEEPRRVRPISGVLIMLCGIAATIFWMKGFTFRSEGAAWLRLLHVAAAGGMSLWGLKSVLIGTKPRSAVGWGARLMPYRIEVTQEGWIYFGIMVAVLIGALVGKSNMLLLVFGLLAGPFVLNGHVALTMLARNVVSRQAPVRAMLGEWFTVDVTLSNRRWWVASWMMVVEDRWQQDEEIVFPLIVFSRVGPGQERTGRYQLKLQRRGRYVCGPFRLSTRFPLGLVERSYVLSNPGEILIHPRIGRLTPLWHREQKDANELVQQAKTRSGAFEDEFHRMREYRQGDSQRSIHWRTSARRNQLMVREHHQMRDTDLAVVIDLWLPNQPTGWQTESVELALSFAATLCLEHSRQSRESTLFIGIAGVEDRQWTGAANPQTMPLICDQLALSEGSHSSALVKLAEACYQIRAPNVHRILITTRPDLTNHHVSAVSADAARRGMPFRVVSANAESMSRFMDLEV